MTTVVDRSPEKCSAVSTMERSMPDYDYSHLVKELKVLVIEDVKATPEKYTDEDIKKVYNDDWFIARYLLRVKMDMNSAHQMIRKSMEFRNSPAVLIKEFPEEFYRIGAMFHYEPDRKGNVPVYMRVRMNQKIPIVAQFLKAFIFKTIEEADKAASGKGIVLVFDLQDAGISNIDMDMLFFVISTLVNYFPKGLSYMLVHELPWFLQSVWHVARKWLSEDHKDLVKFSNSRTIYEYFTEENLPDFLGGTCKRDYRALPSNSITISQLAKQWNLNEDELFRIKKKFAVHLPEDD